MLAKVANKPQSKCGTKRSVCFLTVILCPVKFKYIIAPELGFMQFVIISKLPRKKTPAEAKQSGFRLPLSRIWNLHTKKKIFGRRLIATFEQPTLSTGQE